MDAVQMHLARGPEPKIVIEAHMRALRNIDSLFSDPNSVRMIGLVEAQGDHIRANSYAIFMRELEPTAWFVMHDKNKQQFGYLVDAPQKLKAVTNLSSAISDHRLKLYTNFVCVGRKAFVPRADPPNRRELTSKLLDQTLRLRFDDKGKITAKDGPGKQDDMITALAMGLFQANIIRHTYRRSALEQQM